MRQPRVSLSRKSRLLTFFALAAAAALAAAVYAYALLPWGPWAYTDSAAYVDAARHLLSGQGVVSLQSDGSVILLTHYPPGYPTLIAAAMRLTHNDWIAAGRLLDVLSLTLFLFIVGWWLYEASERPLLGLLGMVLLATSLPVARAFTSLMSEPPFLVMLAAWLYSMWRSVQRDCSRWWWAAVVIAALSVSVRYAGLHAGIVLVLAPLLFWPSQPWRTRLRRAVLSGAVFLLPFGAWMVYSRVAGQSPGGWTAPHQWLPAFGQFLRLTGETFLAAIFPSWAHPPLAAVGAFWAAVVGVTAGWGTAAAHWRKASASPLVTLSLLAALDALAWFPFLAFMFVFIAPPPALDFRMYTPAFTMWLLSGLAALAAWLQAKWPERVRRQQIAAALAILALLGWMKSPASAAHQTLLTMRYFGEGYTARPWQESMAEGVLHDVAALPANTPLYSNNWPGVLIWLERPAFALNEMPYYMLWDEASTKNPRLIQWRAHGGTVVLLWQPGADRSRLWWKALLKHNGGTLCATDPIGALYCRPTVKP